MLILVLLVAFFIVLIMTPMATPSFPLSTASGFLPTLLATEGLNVRAGGADGTPTSYKEVIAVTVTIKSMHAGQGVDYLLRTVAVGDGERSLRDPLTRYYTEEGTPPGYWLGSDQVAFKGLAKAFLRTYNFLSAVMPFGVAGWEKLSIFLDNLVPKLPAPKEDDLAAAILETIDIESYGVEKGAAMKIALHDEDGVVEPVPAAGGGHINEPELERLSSILQAFNDLFGNIPWTDADRVQRLITEEIPRKVAEDVAHALNTRPRKILGWKTPAEGFNEHLLSVQQAGVASTG